MNTFCIQYWKVKKAHEPKVLRRINKNGTPVSTTKYSEVLFYRDIRYALDDARHLMEMGYETKVRKCCKNVNDKFWLI